MAKKIASRIFNLLMDWSGLDNYLCKRYTGYDMPERYMRGHYYSPLPDIREIESRSNDLFCRKIDVSQSINLRTNSQKDLVADLSDFYKEFIWTEQVTSTHRFHLGQDWFCHGDAIILYALLRYLRPKKVIEVGSGFTSALMLDTDEQFLGRTTQFTFIDPYPQRLLSILHDGDSEKAHMIYENVQNVERSIFRNLDVNDVLFIDSSHVSKIGSDVNYIIFEILPTLKPGVVVQFHDMFWPFEYPKEWILLGRAWNEAYLLRAFLQYNHNFEIILFNSYVGYMFEDFIREHIPLFLKNTGGSLWLRKIR